MSLWPRYLDGNAGLWAFRQERLFHRDGRSVAGAFERDSWQRAIFDIVDDPSVRLAFIETPRGYGKTTIAAALATERLVCRPDHSIYVVAADRDQARILTSEANGFVNRDPVFRRICVPLRERIANKLNDSTLEVLSADAASN